MAAMIYEVMDDCHVYNKSVIDNPVGGHKITYTKGASFKAAIIKDSTTEANVAEKQDGIELYTVVVSSGMSLDYHDVIKRDSDDLFLQITSRTRDSKAPARSTIQIAKVNAEPWVIPDGVIVEDVPNSGEA